MHQYCILVCLLIPVNSNLYLVGTKDKIINTEHGSDYNDYNDYIDAYNDDDKAEKRNCDKHSIGVPETGYPVEPVVTRGGPCKIHYDCSIGEVCSSNWKCEMIFCQSTSSCKEKVTFPTVCSNGICSPDAYCKSNAECRRAGKEYVCENKSGQCKPQYGPCHITCDCLDNFGMVNGEALCTKTGTFEESEKVCICRSDHLHQCHGHNKLQTTTSLPPPLSPVVERGLFVPTTATATSLPPPLSPVIEGGIFVTTTTATTTTTKMSTKTTPPPLPSYWCNEDKECPEGYGCDSHVCKQKYVICNDDCVCGKCNDKECLNKTCHCKSDMDDCKNVTKFEKQKITTTDTITTPPEEVSTTTSPPTTIKTNETLKMSDTNDYGAGNTGEKECRIHHECDLGHLCTKDWKCEMIFCKKTEDCKAKVALPTECTKWGLCDANTYCNSNAECKEAGQEYVCENNSGHCKPQYGECHMTKDCLDMGMEKGEALCTQTGTFEEKAKVCLCRSNRIAVCGKN